MVDVPEMMSSEDQWDADRAIASAYVEGMADALEPSATDLPSQFHVAELREWARSFGRFYASRSADISGTEREKTLAEWFRFWRFVEESTDPEDPEEEEREEQPETDSDGYREGDVDWNDPQGVNLAHWRGVDVGEYPAGKGVAQ